ncbi:hypothetical protein [Desulfovibrio subterraneus]|uniref:Uncharacterized protein n=1 Tax=Desulfovibrio subterraneus TaxID=2718620 RepID=A0A7J0BK66_9BACT|nr:hypothetical protein [Desulfovibrio subterraneus]GFM34183.1 hypothetical protein DSM101010T_25480 [Desulfovibrio subterraneus]
MLKLILSQATVPLIIIATIMQFISLTESKILEKYNNKISKIESIDKLSNDTNMQYETKKSFENIFINSGNTNKDASEAFIISKSESIARMKYLNYIIETELGKNPNKDDYTKVINDLKSLDPESFINTSQSIFLLLKKNHNELIAKKEKLSEKSRTLDLDIYKLNTYSLLISLLSAICAGIPKKNT